MPWTRSDSDSDSNADDNDNEQNDGEAAGEEGGDAKGDSMETEGAQTVATAAAAAAEAAREKTTKQTKSKTKTKKCLAVRPERNKALFFCNVLPDGAPDARTAHRATPVDGGYRKYGMNVWPTDTSMLDFAQDDQLGVVPPKRGQSILTRSKVRTLWTPALQIKGKW